MADRVVDEPRRHLLRSPGGVESAALGGRRDSAAVPPRLGSARLSVPDSSPSKHPAHADSSQPGLAPSALYVKKRTFLLAQYRTFLFAQDTCRIFACHGKVASLDCTGENSEGGLHPAAVIRAI